MPEIRRAEQTTPMPDEVDALSDVLHAIHLRGRDVSRTRAERALAHDEPEGVRVVYLVEEGRLRIALPDRAVIVDAGGLALVAGGAAHSLRAGPGSAWVTGVFDVDESIADPVLRVLPSAVTIEPGERTRPWLDVALALIVAELTDPNPGGRVMVSRLLDLLFIRALRDWAAHGAERESGLLTAAMDRCIARALAAVHGEPGRAWSVRELAERAGLSRSAFAERFAGLVGASPGRYVAQQRLAHAEHLLSSTDLPVSRVAAETGYESEAAFSRAFAKRHGAPPRAWRRAQG